MKKLISVAALLLSIGVAKADTYVKPGTYGPLGCFQITALSSAVGFPTIPNGTQLILISVETQPVRMTDDGVTTPTASVGMVLPSGGQPWAYTGNFNMARFIQTAASATIDYCTYR